MLTQRYGFLLKPIGEEAPNLYVYKTEQEAKDNQKEAILIAGCDKKAKLNMQDIIDATSFIVFDITESQIQNKKYQSTSEGEVILLNDFDLVINCYTKEQVKKQNKMMKEIFAELETDNYKDKLKKAEQQAKDYIQNIIDTKGIIIEGEHLTHFKWEFEKRREDFIESLARQIYSRFMYKEEEPITDETEFHMYSGDKCGVCGEYIHYTLIGNTLKECELDTSEGFRKSKWIYEQKPCMTFAPYSVEITIPTGNLIVVSWTENGGEVILPCIDENEQHLDINAFKGKVDTSNLYANKLNMAHFFVGNNSPSVFVAKKNNGYVAIGRTGYNEDTDKDIPIMKGLKEVGSICTDLWWSTAFDYSVYEKMCIERYLRQLREELAEGEELTEKQIAEATQQGIELAKADCKKDEYGVVNIKVKPGKYKCTTYYACKPYNPDEDEYGKPELYSEMEWISEQ